MDGLSDDSTSADECEDSSPYEVRDWCSCGHCQNMGMRHKEICCSNHDANNRLQDTITDYGRKDALGCIIDHPGFHCNCLVAEVLDDSWKTYKQMYGKAATEYFLTCIRVIKINVATLSFSLSYVPTRPMHNDRNGRQEKRPGGRSVTF